MLEKYAYLFEEHTALIIVDMVNGFLTEGPLSSPRSAAVLPACETLLRTAHAAGAPVLAFADCHEPDCIEFQSFPPHCIRGTSESEIAPSLREIGGFAVIEKNSTNGAIHPAFQKWLDAHGSLTRIVVCGVCTDICVMQFCLTLKTLCNQNERPLEVVLVREAAATYDAPGHDGDASEEAAVQFMQQAGIRIV